MVLAQITLRVVPLLGCVFLTTIGSKISNVVRIISVYNAATAPVIIPVLTPFFETGLINQVLQLIFASTSGVFIQPCEERRGHEY